MALVTDYYKREGRIRFGGWWWLEVYRLRFQGDEARVMCSADLLATHPWLYRGQAAEECALPAVSSQAWHHATRPWAILLGCTVAAQQARQNHRLSKRTHDDSYLQAVRQQNFPRRMPLPRRRGRKGVRRSLAAQWSLPAQFASRDAHSYSYDDITLLREGCRVNRCPRCSILRRTGAEFHHCVNRWG